MQLYQNASSAENWKFKCMGMFLSKQADKSTDTTNRMPQSNCREGRRQSNNAFAEQTNKQTIRKLKAAARIYENKPMLISAGSTQHPAIQLGG
jgi:hypothetical protein